MNTTTTTTRYRIVIRDLRTGTETPELTTATYNLRHGEYIRDMKNATERQHIAWRQSTGDTWYAGHEYFLQAIES